MSNKFLKYFLWAVFFFCLGASLTSCQKDSDQAFNPCISGNCEARAYPDPVSQPNAYQDDNGYWHLFYEGASYFTLVLKYGLTKQMDAANQPQILTEYTTDTWLTAINGYSFWSSRYNPLGSDYTQNFQTVIADTMVVVSILPSEVKEMNNMSGQYYRDCMTPGCGLGPKPTVRPNIAHKSKASFMYFPEQAQTHDTVTVFLSTSFSERGTLEQEIVESEVKIIL